MTSPTKELQQLINNLHGGNLKLEDFKHSAMLLARGGVDLTVYGSTGSRNTLLHCLVLTNKDGVNDTEITELLTLQKDKVNAESGWSCTALTSLIDQLAKEKCSIEDFKHSAMLLARGGVDLTVYGSTGSRNTLLHCLVLTNKDGVNDTEITELLTLQKDKVNAESGWSCTALTSLIDQLAKEKCSIEDFKHSAMLLARGGVDLTVYGSTGSRNTLLHCLVLTNKDGVNDTEITELLTLQKDKVNAESGWSCTALTSLIDQLAKEKCSIEDFKHSAMLLARGGVDLTVYGSTGSRNTLLHCLVLTNKDGVNDTEITELLTLQKDKVNAESGWSCTALTSLIDQLAKEKCSIEDFKHSAMLLARGGVDLTVYGSTGLRNTLLHCLVLRNEEGINDIEILELVKLKSDIFNIPDDYGHLPLEALLLKQPQISIEVIIKLIISGNALHYKNTKEKTLIHISCIIGNLELVQYLASNGLDITGKTTSGRTTLHCSASSNNQALWQWLYEHKVDIDAQDGFKRTALHLATLNNNKAMVKWLIDHYADRLVKDKNGETALSIAKKNGANEITELLTLPQVQLFATIHSLKEYGILLKSQGASKGQIAIDLAADLKLKADTFFKNAATPNELKAFQDEFSLLLNSKNHEMSEYRISWSTIIANIAIALTGIGALLLVGRLIYTQATEGRPLFFFQKHQTTSEEKVSEVSQAMLSLGSI